MCFHSKLLCFLSNCYTYLCYKNWQHLLHDLAYLCSLLFPTACVYFYNQIIFYNQQTLYVFVNSGFFHYSIIFYMTTQSEHDLSILKPFWIAIGNETIFNWNNTVSDLVVTKTLSISSINLFNYFYIITEETSYTCE